MNWNHRTDYLRNLLSRPVCGTSLAVFRISFGLVMLQYISKFLKKLPSGDTVLDAFISNWSFHFRYPGFEWVHPLPPSLLEIHFWVMCVASVMVMLGIFYRYAITYVFIGFTYIFLLEATRYNNHYYLMSLVAFILIWMPADGRFSLRNLIQRWRNRPVVSTTVPIWNVWVLRFEMFLVYFYGGVAKFNKDWLTGEPMFPPASKLLTFLQKWLPMPEAITVKEVALFVAYGGLIFDLVIGFMLLHRKTRLLAYIGVLVFHIHNNYIFTIGVFPLMASACTLIFFPPDWPLQLKDRVLGWFGRKKEAVNETLAASGESTKPLTVLTFYFLAFFVLWQSLFPLRHFFIEGDANWTEEGHRFSWRMMLRSKPAGHLSYWIKDEGTMTGEDNTLDWEALPPDVPRAVFMPVKSALFDWNDHDGISITWEPLLGYRVFYQRPSWKPPGLSKEALTKEWQSLFGRSPRVEDAITIEAALDEIESLLLSNGHTAEASDELQHLARIRVDLKDIQSEGNTKEGPRVAMINSINLMNASALATEINAILKRLHPFALQSATYDGKTFFVINDDEITNANAEEELATLSQGNPYKVWIDMARVRAVDWREFPRAYVASQGVGLRVYWNYYPDIATHEASRFATLPFFIRQYGRHIATEWEKMTGRRPEVRASGTVMLNYHYPQAIVDPSVDIASVPYHFFRHNTWITERPDRRIGIGEAVKKP